jgi:thiol-disulfide isomerase/thioredoxin
MTPSPDPSEKKQAPFYGRFRVLPAAFILGAMAGLAVVYGMGGFQRNAGVESACRPAADLAKKLTPLFKGEIAALTPAKTPIRTGHIAFHDADGRGRTLADWKDRVVLLNLWATWCVPCKKEMPALDALQKKLGGPGFEVVAVNIDTRDPDKARAWLKDNGISQLSYYADSTAKIFQDLKAAGRAFGMPTTILIDRHGCEIASLAGPAEWASADAVDLITAVLKN